MSAPTAWKVLSSQFKAITDDNVCVIHWAIVWPEAKWRRFSQDSIVTILIFRERVLGYVSQGAEPVWDIIARQLQKSWMRWQYFQKLDEVTIFSKFGWGDNIFESWMTRQYFLDTFFCHRRVCICATNFQVSKLSPLSAPHTRMCASQIWPTWVSVLILPPTFKWLARLDLFLLDARKLS